MSRVYYAAFEGISVSAAQDLFELQAPADATVVVRRITVTNETSETSEQLAIAVKRGEGTITSGSGGGTVTPVPMSKGDPAFGGTVERNNTTKAVAGTGAIKVLHREGFNVVGSGFDWHGEIQISPSDYAIVELIGAPASALTLSGVMVFEEIGG
jgi:hypothetical protein